MLIKALATGLKVLAAAPVKVNMLPVETIAATVAVSAHQVKASGLPVAIKAVILS